MHDETVLFELVHLGWGQREQLEADCVCENARYRAYKMSKNLKRSHRSRNVISSLNSVCTPVHGLKPMAFRVHFYSTPGYRDSNHRYIEFGLIYASSCSPYGHSFLLLNL